MLPYQLLVHTPTALNNQLVDFELNICDDLEYLYDSDFFHKKKGELFDVDDIDEDRLLDSDTRNYRKKIVFLDNNDELNTNDISLDCDTLDDSLFEDMFILSESNLKIHNDNLHEEYSCDAYARVITRSSDGGVFLVHLS